MKTVGSYELKTHLAKFLKLVTKGEIISITLHGKPVASLVPPMHHGKKDKRSVIKQFKEFREKHTLGPDLTIRDLIEEGRRY